MASGHVDCATYRVFEFQMLMVLVPLEWTSHLDAGQPQKYDPRQLLMQTHDEFFKNVQDIVTAHTCADKNRLSKLYGIKGKTS